MRNHHQELQATLIRNPVSFAKFGGPLNIIFPGWGGDGIHVTSAVRGRPPAYSKTGCWQHGGGRKVAHAVSIRGYNHDMNQDIHNSIDALQENRYIRLLVQDVTASNMTFR
eukprot:4203917-Amphidinium_carterae.1